jgi:hypothetical protein
LGHLKSFLEKILRAREAIHADSRFSASRSGSFFELLAGASLNGVSGETNLLCQYPCQHSEITPVLSEFSMRQVLRKKEE